MAPGGHTFTLPKSGCETVKLCETGIAGAYCEFPDCDASTVHVPAAIGVTVEPETVQTPPVKDEKATGRPELAEAVRERFWPASTMEIGLSESAGLLNVIVWSSPAIVMAQLEAESSY